MRGREFGRYRCLCSATRRQTDINLRFIAICDHLASATSADKTRYTVVDGVADDPYHSILLLLLCKKIRTSLVTSMNAGWSNLTSLVLSQNQVVSSFRCNAVVAVESCWLIQLLFSAIAAENALDFYYVNVCPFFFFYLPANSPRPPQAISGKLFTHTPLGPDYEVRHSDLWNL